MIKNYGIHVLYTFVDNEKENWKEKINPNVKIQKNKV